MDNQLIEEVKVYRNLQYQAKGETEPWRWEKLSRDDQQSWIDRYNASRNEQELKAKADVVSPIPFVEQEAIELPQTTQRTSPFSDYVVSRDKKKGGSK